MADMCGIAGLMDHRKRMSRGELADVARRMADTLAHRGPDADGAWVDDSAGVGLGYRRLAIIDLSAEGNQPMVSPEGRFVIVYNGEVYNFPELRRELEASGHGFRGHSDTEVVLTAIVAWGLRAALERMVGMFAFALWDRDERRLHLVRDRLGIKPLYYGRIDGRFVFASEARALRICPGFTGEIDREALALYMLRNCIPAPYSIYRGIHKLPPGSILTLDDKGGEAVISPYWSLRQVAEAGARDPFGGTDGEAVEALESVIDEAVRARLIADVPVGAFLSGGIDSSIVTASMTHSHAKRVRTYTVGFETADYDEAGDAAAVARHLGTAHHPHTLTAAEAVAVVPKLGRLFDEPFADSSQIPTYLVAEIARRDVKVVLSGDGGDELFAGYNRHLWCERVASWAAGKPRLLLSGLARALTVLAPESWDRVLGAFEPVLPARLRLSHPGDKLHKLAGVLGAGDAGAMYRALVGHWHDPTSVVIGGREPTSLASQNSSWADIPDFTRQMLYLDALTYLPDDILTKVDRATMAVGLEARVPLLDHRVVAFAWSLPTHLKIRAGVGKHILRQALYRRVPQTIFERPKRGFEVPLHQWLRGPLRDWAEDLLAPARLRDEGFFAPAPIEAMWREHLSGRRNWHHHLWDVLMFNAWLAEQKT